MPTAVVSTDFDNRILVWNPAAERTFGWSAREVLGTQLAAIPAEKLEEHQELRRRARAGDATHSLETIRITRDGTRFPASVSVAPVFDEDGSVTSLLAVVEDITGRKRIKRDLREKGATLSAVTQALNTFLDTGDWSAASQFLLDFALRQTQSQYGFLGVVLEGPVLRVLAHSGVAWHPTLDRELYEEKKAQHLAHGHFEIRHEQNLLGEVILNGKTVVSNSPNSDRRSGGLPPGHPPMTSFLGVPIFKGNVADDEAALRHAVVELLRSSGYNVLEANSALAAVDIARQHTGKIEVLLTDIVMPGLRGDDLARRVASFHPGVQVIYMSGYAEGFPEAEIPANAVFLQKPFRFATLLEQLKLMRRAS